MTFSGRNYYEIYLLILTAAWAAASWLTGMDGETIEAALPGLGRHLLFGGLLTGSLIALGGIAIGTITGLLVERAGLIALAGWCAAAAVLILSQADAIHALYVVPLIGAYALVHLVRAGQVARDVTRIRATLRRGEATS